MKNAVGILLVCAFLACGTAADAKNASSFTVPQAFLGKAKRDRHTIFLGTFDKADTNDADFAAGLPLAGGFGCDPKVGGEVGKGVAIYGRGAHLNYRGYGNLRPDKSTVQFWVKSKPGANIWNDGKDHFLFATHYLDRALAVMKKGKGNRLQIWTQHHRSRLDDKYPAVIPVADLDPGKWHHVMASWDLPRGRLWLAVDGKGVEAHGRPERPYLPMYIFFTGGGWHGHHGHIPADAIFDELKISRLTLPELIQQQKAKLAVPDDDIMKVQDSVRKYLAFADKLAIHGGWPSPNYTWPALMPCHTNARNYVLPDEVYQLTHGYCGGTPTLGITYLYAYEIVGDWRWLDRAMKTGHFLLACQQAEGHWAYQYRLTDLGLTPYRGARRVILQDGHQNQAMMLLAYLYCVTKDKRFLKGALKSADFIVKAQNPNGSFSHHYVVDKGYGENARGQRGGGEFNDECTQDSMNILVLAWHLTRDPKYLKSWRRAADWVVAAQLPPPTFGWADQYDGDNNPAPARHFEPPAASLIGGIYACRILLTAYYMTGDKKYIEPLRKHLDWLLNKAASKQVKGKRAYYTRYHHENGRPIAMLHRKIYYLDSTEQLAELKKDPYFGSRRMVSPIWSQHFREIGKHLRGIEKSGKRRKSTPVSGGKLGPNSLKGALQVVARQHPAGPWVGGVSRKLGGVGCTFRVSETRVLGLLNALERVKIASGLPHRTNYVSPMAQRTQRLFTRTPLAFIPWLNVTMPAAK